MEAGLSGGVAKSVFWDRGIDQKITDVLDHVAMAEVPVGQPVVLLRDKNPIGLIRRSAKQIVFSSQQRKIGEAKGDPLPQSFPHGQTRW